MHRGAAPGGPYARLTPVLLGAPSFTDLAVQNGTAYHYVVTAVDVAGNESAPNLEVENSAQIVPNVSAGSSSDHTGRITSAASVAGLPGIAGHGHALHWASEADDEIDDCGEVEASR